MATPHSPITSACDVEDGRKIKVKTGLRKARCLRKARAGAFGLGGQFKPRAAVQPPLLPPNLQARTHQPGWAVEIAAAAEAALSASS